MLAQIKIVLNEITSKNKLTSKSKHLVLKEIDIVFRFLLDFLLNVKVFKT